MRCLSPSCRELGNGLSLEGARRGHQIHQQEPGGAAGRRHERLHRRQPQIEPAHLLKALMDQRQGVAVALLKAAGANPDAVSVAASTAIHAPARRRPGPPWPSRSSPRPLLQVIKAAQQEAEQLGDAYVSTEHLLLGLSLDDGRRREGPAGQRCRP